MHAAWVQEVGTGFYCVTATEAPNQPSVQCWGKRARARTCPTMLQINPAPCRLQVGIKSQLSGATVRLALFLGNKAAEPLTQVRKRTQAAGPARDGWALALAGVGGS